MKPAKFNKIQLKQLNESEAKRLDEVMLWHIINQYTASKAANVAPMGTTIPHMLASLIRGVNPGVIEYAYNKLNMPEFMPTSMDIIVLMKYKNISALKSPVSAETYYKWLGRWVEQGQPIGTPVLAELQHIHIKKFIKGYMQAFLGDNKHLALMEG